MSLSHMIDSANDEPNPTLCNLKITLAHKELAQRLSEVTGHDAGANFHTWAVWGSKKAGVTIREEDLDEEDLQVQLEEALASAYDVLEFYDGWDCTG